MNQLMSKIGRKLFGGQRKSRNKKLAKGSEINGQNLTQPNQSIFMADNFLSKDDFIKVQNWALSTPCDLNREDRKWSMSIVRNFSECYSSRQWSSAEDDMPAEARLFVNAIKQTDMIEANATIVLGVLRWQQKSGMGEHADAHTDTAITFYVNDTWKDNWYGDLIFYESMEDYRNGFGRAITPKANRLVINKDTVMHKVTYCSELAVERVTVQAFVLKD